jgi:hypothetical protein
MKISKFKKKYLPQLKADDRFGDKNLYPQRILKRNRLFESLHQKYGLHTLPDGG